MFEYVRATSIWQRIFPSKEVVKTALQTTTVDPIVALANRSQWTIDSIKSSINSLGSQNQEIQTEHNVREEAKNKLVQEQNALHNVRVMNEAVIAKASAIFETPKV